jgi:hypothetical protein
MLLQNNNNQSRRNPSPTRVIISTQSPKRTPSPGQTRLPIIFSPPPIDPNVIILEQKDRMKRLE